MTAKSQGTGERICNAQNRKRPKKKKKKEKEGRKKKQRTNAKVRKELQT